LGTPSLVAGPVRPAEDLLSVRKRGMANDYTPQIAEMSKNYSELQLLKHEDHQDHKERQQEFTTTNTTDTTNCNGKSNWNHR
jgi:hypothetical protein